MFDMFPGNAKRGGVRNAGKRGILRHTAKSGYSSLGADMTSQIDKTGDGTTGRGAGRRECYSDEKDGQSEDRGLDEEAGDGRRADSYDDSWTRAWTMDNYGGDIY